MAVRWTEENARLESINAWTHGIGFLASLPAGVVLVQLAAAVRAPMVAACVVYSLSLAAMYLFSTLSHAIREPRLRHVARAWDQGTVYLLIAGTFTPFIWAYLSGSLRLSMITIVWLAAAAGFYSKVIAQNRLNNMTSVTYVLLGWLPAMSLFSYVSLPCFSAMAFGGVLYTLGTRFLQNDHRRWYFHALWHIMVIVASACHYAAIILFPILGIDRQP